jgi:hypothetical protein
MSFHISGESLTMDFKLSVFGLMVHVNLHISGRTIKKAFPDPTKVTNFTPVVRCKVE